MNLCRQFLQIRTQAAPQQSHAENLGEGRYRVEWDAHVRVPLFSGVTLGLQLFDYFDSDPPKSRIKRNDFGVLSTLGLTF